MSEGFFGVAKKWGFWHRQRLLFVALPVIGLFWLFQGVGVLSGRSPLIAWMVCAGLAVIILTVMTFEATEQAQGQAKEGLLALLLQLMLILVGNSAVLVLELLSGVVWTPLDTAITALACTGATGVAVFFVAHKQPVNSPWARSGFTVSLKCLPQVFQAWPLLFTNGGLHWLVVVMLVAQGWLRLSPLVALRQQASGVQLQAPQRALLVSAEVDFITIMLVAICYVIGVVGWLR